MVLQLRIGSIDHKRFKGTFPKLSRNVRYNQTNSGMCWQEFKDFLRDTTWPQGYLTKYRLYPLIGMYNRILEQYY